jgi:peroxiredoxin
VESIFRIGDRAPDATVLNTQGQPVALSEVWRDGPVLLTFLRHFG